MGTPHRHRRAPRVSIGQALCRDLYGDYDLVALSRDAKKATGVVGPYAKVVEWDGDRATGPWAHEIDGAEATVNLAGESIGSGRWSRAKKVDILQSRTHAARAIIDATLARDNLKVFVQASAVGFYGVRGDEVLDEEFGLGTGCWRGRSQGQGDDRRRWMTWCSRWAHPQRSRAGDRRRLPKLMRPFRFLSWRVRGHGQTVVLVDQPSG